MSWKFWKKDDLALPDFKSELKGMDLGLPKENSSGLDFSSSFQTPQAPSMPVIPPAQSFSQQYPSPQSSFPSTPSSFPNQSYTPQSMTPVAEDSGNAHLQKDLEVIAAKLETIRAQLDMLNARLANLERSGEGPKRPWY